MTECRREQEGKREGKNLCWHLVCLIIWSVHDGSGFERHFVQLEVCSKFPPAPDRDEVALSEDAVAPSQQREPKHCKWSKQKLMSITSHTCLTQDDIGWIFPQLNCVLLYFNYSHKCTASTKREKGKGFCVERNAKHNFFKTSIYVGFGFLFICHFMEVPSQT